MHTDTVVSGGPPSKTLGLWRRLPAIIRALVVGFVILQLGGSVPGALLVANLKLSPSIPWFLPATGIWLWLFWRYVNGWGWPQSTAEIRGLNIRARPLPVRVWFWSLFAGGLGMVSTMGIIFVASHFGNLPDRAFQPPFEVSAYPPWTVASIFIAIAGTAGVVEEAAFRGHMLSMIQRRHGWVIGIAVVAVMFYAAHLSHAYATLAFAPFFVVYSALHGLLVYLTRSILPSVILHAVADVIVVPMQFGVLASPAQMTVVTHGGITLLFAAAAVPAFRRLAAVAREAQIRR